MAHLTLIQAQRPPVTSLWPRPAGESSCTRSRALQANGARSRLYWAVALPFLAGSPRSSLRTWGALRRKPRAMIAAGACGCCKSGACSRQERRDVVGVGVVSLMGGAAVAPAGAGAAVPEETGNSCIACKGTGFLECLRCKGTGQMSVIGFTDKYDSCTECSATGNAICPRCDSTGLSKARFKALRKDRKFLKAVNQNLFSHPILNEEGRGQMRAKLDAAIAGAEERLGLVV
mmetsp:Transcript_93/g.258  ORF Transcript_93/g.258 Transcript_93/m.258 type:complete len:232 (-) Transcript_93:12-707(-)